MRHGGEHTMNAKSRRAQRQRLVTVYGNGETVQCVHCGQTLTAKTVERDRKIPGGTYRFENLQPSCSPCNKSRSNKTSWVSPIMALQSA